MTETYYQVAWPSGLCECVCPMCAEHARDNPDVIDVSALNLVGECEWCGESEYYAQGVDD